MCESNEFGSMKLKFETIIEFPGNNSLLSRKQYLSLIENVKDAKAKVKKAPRHVTLLQNYDVLAVGGHEKLIVPMTQSNPDLIFYCPSDMLFDILYETHLTLGHGGVESMVNDLRQVYKNITSSHVQTFLNLCAYCQQKRTIEQECRVMPMKSSSIYHHEYQMPVGEKVAIPVVPEDEYSEEKGPYDLSIRSRPYIKEELPDEKELEDGREDLVGECNKDEVQNSESIFVQTLPPIKTEALDADDGSEGKEEDSEEDEVETERERSDKLDPFMFVKAEEFDEEEPEENEDEEDCDMLVESESVFVKEETSLTEVNPEGSEGSPDVSRLDPANNQLSPGIRVRSKQDLMTKARSSDKLPYVCNICGRGFTKPSNLTVHLRVHTGEKPYDCTVCQKSFSRQYDLLIHLRTHSGEKPFVCQICQKSFKHRKSLSTHLLMHKGEIPFSCPTCNRTFSHKNSYLRHLRTHTGEKPFGCTICGTNFTRRHSLMKHMRTHMRN